MGRAVAWRVQAHWSVGGEAKSYAPVFAFTEAEAEAAVDDIASTLSHFPTLEIRVELVDRSAAEAEIAARVEPSDRAERPLLHIYDDARTGTICGVEIDDVNVAMAAELIAQSNFDKCRRCQGALPGAG